MLFNPSDVICGFWPGYPNQAPPPLGPPPGSVSSTLSGGQAGGNNLYSGPISSGQFSSSFFASGGIVGGNWGGYVATCVACGNTFTTPTLLSGAGNFCQNCLSTKSQNCPLCGYALLPQSTCPFCSPIAPYYGPTLMDDPKPEITAGQKAWVKNALGEWTYKRDKVRPQKNYWEK